MIIKFIFLTFVYFILRKIVTDKFGVRNQINMLKWIFLGIYLFAIIGAEYILKWLPIGTHDWDKLVKPKDLIFAAKKNNLELIKTDGVSFNILKNEWLISRDESVNYISQFKKIKKDQIYKNVLEKFTDAELIDVEIKKK